MAAGQRSVTLPADQHEAFRVAAEAQGMSLAAWLTEAGRTRRRQEAATAYAQLCAQPEVAAEIADYRLAQSRNRKVQLDRLQETA